MWLPCLSDVCLIHVCLDDLRFWSFLELDGNLQFCPLSAICLFETPKTIQLVKQFAHMANKHLPSVLHKLGIMV